jgi:hypothetical protein
VTSSEARNKGILLLLLFIGWPWHELPILIPIAVVAGVIAVVMPHSQPAVFPGNKPGNKFPFIEQVLWEFNNFRRWTPGFWAKLWAGMPDQIRFVANLVFWSTGLAAAVSTILHLL